MTLFAFEAPEMISADFLRQFFFFVIGGFAFLFISGFCDWKYIAKSLK
jgi:hypothetical protein